jgi:ketosteroid isomerase-like protein
MSQTESPGRCLPGAPSGCCCKFAHRFVRRRPKIDWPSRRVTRSKRAWVPNRRVHQVQQSEQGGIEVENTLVNRSAIAAMSLALGALACLPAAAAPVFNDPADLKAIHAIEEDLATQTSMKNLIKYYAPDAIVIDIFAPGYYKGTDQIYKAFEAQMSPIQSMQHKIPDVNIVSNGNFACAAMQIQFNAKMKDGKTNDIALRQLDAFKKIDGQWKIVQQHISLPVDPKTGMAVVNGPLPVRGPISWTKASFAGPAVPPAQAKAEIRKWMDVGALSTSLDMLMQYYGPSDDTLIYDTFYPGELRGLKEIRNYYAAIMNSYNSIKVKMPEFSVDSDGSFGVQIDTQDMELDMKDGTKKYISLRQSDCMRRVNGKWYSFFEMISYPIDPKTGKAIMENPAAFK